MTEPNSSLNYTLWWSKKDLIGTSIMCVQGFGLTTTNLLLMLTILYHKNLRARKEYLVILGVAITDGITGLGLLFTCMVIVYGFITGLAGYPFTHHQCLTSVHVHMMICGISAQGWMLVAQSMDRLLVIATPFHYFSFTTRYAWGLIGFVFAYVIGQSACLTYISWGDQTVVTKDHCILHRALSPVVFTFWNKTHLTCGCLCVSLYAVVMILYWRHQKKVSPTPTINSNNNSQMKRQRKVTRSMGVSSLFTLLFFVMPRLLNDLMITFAPHRTFIYLMRALSFILYNVNSMLNLLIYVKCHKEIRMGLAYLFKLKVLPPLENIGTRKEINKAK